VRKFHFYLLFAVVLLTQTLFNGCDQKSKTPVEPDRPDPTEKARETPEPKQEPSSAPTSDPKPAMTPPATPAPPAAAPEVNAPEAKGVEEAANPIIERKLLTADEAADGWISLFDGTTLFGWKSTHEDINWTVTDGVITADSGANGALMTTVPFADYELVCEYRMAAGGNSGVFLRSASPPTNPSADFYEVNIVDTHPQGYLTGSLAMRQKATVDLPGSGDWQTLRMIAEGRKITVQHNDQTVLEFTDESEQPLLNGLIGLQKNSGKIEFRKVNLKPRALTSLFNNSDLTGWTVVPGAKGEFLVADGAIHVKSGLGFLETEGTWKDFLFQTQVKTGAKDVNSGFFFRTLKGTEAAPSNGYEAQVHHGFKAGDRNQPENAGTGAIFRRVDARRVVGNDLQWSTVTLVASGPQIAAWVDGYQVVNWEDTRATDENPRKGKRVEGGHFSLQGHDPTTDAFFREIRVVELPEWGAATPETKPEN